MKRFSFLAGMDTASHCMVTYPYFTSLSCQLSCYNYILNCLESPITVFYFSTVHYKLCEKFIQPLSSNYTLPNILHDLQVSKLHFKAMDYRYDYKITKG